MTKVQIGSVSSGTLRNEDLLEAFADELERLFGGEQPLAVEARDAIAALNNTATADDEIDAGEVINELIDALNEYAPPHTYFGALEGDGADFGFWPEIGSFPECEIHYTHEPGPLDQNSEFVDLSCNVYIEVNDHGNITVSELRGEEIWSAV